MTVFNLIFLLINIYYFCFYQPVAVQEVKRKQKEIEDRIDALNNPVKKDDKYNITVYNKRDHLKHAQRIADMSSIVIKYGGDYKKN